MVLELLVIVACAIAALACVFAFLAWRGAAQPADSGGAALLERLALVHEASQQHPKLLRDETARLSDANERAAAQLREEVRNLVQGFQGALEQRFGLLGTDQTAASALLRQELTDGQKAAAEMVDGATRRFGEHQRERLDDLQREQKAALDKVEAELKRLVQANAEEQGKARQTLTEQLDKVRSDSEVRQKEMRETLDGQFGALRKENEDKLEKMRLTVDEKLQGTLEQRLGEKFKTVSDHLENVHKGLGEMQALATGVGDLKRALTNVKSRGTWGEVQLGSLLEDMLTPDQYGRQVEVLPASGKRVDFAVHLPGSSETGQVLLPLDCKFPHEDYDRLLAAQETGDPALVEAAAVGLERAVRLQAKSMAEKYIHPPHTTPFAVMYLPTEGLFAEVVRRPGLSSELSATYNVTVTGPTTLAALLNSLKMGFQTLEIRRNAHNIMQILGKARTEFDAYGTALEAVDRKLDEAKKKVHAVGVRHRAVARSLRDVEAAPAVEGQPRLLALASIGEDEDEAA